MAQIKGYVKTDKYGVIDIEEKYFDVESSGGKTIIKIPAEYEPQSSEGNRYKWSAKMNDTLSGISSVTSVYNVSFLTDIKDACNPYTTNVDGMFKGCTSLVDYSFFDDHITGFNNTYSGTTSMAATIVIPSHVDYLDNTFRDSSCRRIIMDATPSYINNCFYNAQSISSVFFTKDFQFSKYGGFLDTKKPSSSRLDIYMPEWETLTPTEHWVNRYFKVQADAIFSKHIEWDYTTAEKYGIYYNRAEQIYVHYGLPKFTDRKGLFLNPDQSSTLMEAYRTGSVTDII